MSGMMPGSGRSSSSTMVGMEIGGRLRSSKPHISWRKGTSRGHRERGWGGIEATALVTGGFQQVGRLTDFLRGLEVLEVLSGAAVGVGDVGGGGVGGVGGVGGDVGGVGGDGALGAVDAAAGLGGRPGLRLA